MGKYVGRLVTSFIMYTIALVVLVVVGLMVYGWIYDSLGNSYYFDGRSSASDTGDRSEYSTAMFGLLFASLSLTALCVLLSFIMMCADCCCRITKCMTVIPKITTGFGTVAGLLADAACVIFLIKLYVVEKIVVVKVYPGYSFYIVSVTGIFLMVAGCILAGVKHATKVEDAPVPVTVVATTAASQSQAMSMYQGQQMSGGYPGYQAAGVQPFYPQSNFYAAASNGQAAPVRIFMTNAATQTWTEEGKKK